MQMKLVAVRKPLDVGLLHGLQTLMRGLDMTTPACPQCYAKPVAAYFKPHFDCPSCGARLSSNLRAVSLVEWAVGVVPVLLIAAALLQAEAFTSWSFAQVLLLLFLPACVVHWVVLRRYLKLTAES